MSAPVDRGPAEPVTRRTRCGAWAAAGLAAVLLAVAPASPVQAIVVPKFGGAPKPHPSGQPHETSPGAGAEAGSHGAIGARGRAARAFTPELLREAESAHAAEAQAEAARRSAEQQAAGAQAATQAPWPGSPHLRVRLTGDAVRDAALLRALSEELATPIDPDRLHAVSLADDARSDDMLARAQPPRTNPALQRLQRFLRRGPAGPTESQLVEVLRPLAGHTLLLMGHIDPATGALVFKGPGGPPRHVDLAVLEPAAQTAGVQLLVVGCRSAQRASVGMAQDLNALDAAQALARALGVRPRTLFDLYDAISGAHRVVLIDPERFHAAHTADLTDGAEGPTVSTVAWMGPTARAAWAAAMRPSASASAAAGDPAPAGASATWPANPALPWLALAAGLSLLGGGTLAWRRLPGTWERARWLAKDGVLHLAAVPFALTVLAEAVAGENATWWAWGAGTGLVGAAGYCTAVARRDASVQAMRALWFTGALRFLLLGLPIVAVAVLHTGWVEWRALQPGLLHLYRLGRPLPEPMALFGLACLAWFACVMVAAAVGAVLAWRTRRQARRERHALWDAHLAAEGVPEGRARAAAIRSRQRFEDACRPPLHGTPRPDLTRVLATWESPDPWAVPPATRAWQLLAVPLEPERDGLAPEVAFALVRLGGRFVHPLPHRLVQRWRDRDVPSEALPALMARVEPRLRRVDYVAPRTRPRLGLVLAFGLVLAGAFVALGFWPDSDDGWRTFCWFAGALLLALFDVVPAGIGALAAWHDRWLRRVRAPATGAGAAGAAT